MFATILRQDSETMPMVSGEGHMETLLGGAISDLWAKAATGEVTDPDQLGAAAVVTSVPAVLAFLPARRYLVRGLAAG